MPPSGAREGEISREYGCFCLGRRIGLIRKKCGEYLIIRGLYSE
jgi:hypothetical protein